MKKEPDKTIPEYIRERIWVEEAYLLFLNNYALKSGFISKIDHNNMIRKIKYRTYSLEKRAKESLM